MLPTTSIQNIYYSLQQQKAKNLKRIATITQFMAAWRVCSTCTWTVSQRFLWPQLLMQRLTLLLETLQKYSTLSSANKWSEWNTYHSIMDNVTTESLTNTILHNLHVTINIWVPHGLTFTPSLTRLWTWFGLRGALLSHMLVSSLLMPNTLPRPQPVLLGLVDEVSDRWR